ncbi:hypothetical protein K8Q98_02305 [Candidatus Nomurabacteria bacterium]|nr:hypothetical protein [Candidatus Nomurabacteria bacterium]
MKEIEIKSYLRDKNKVISNLENLGCVLSEPIKQIDTVYARIIGKVEEYLSNDHFVRIREKSDGKFIFTVKGFVGGRKDLVKTEHETEILKPKEMESALLSLGVPDTDSINKGYDIMMVEKMFGK